MTTAESLQTLREALDRHAQSPDLPRLLKQVRRALLQRLDMAVSFGEESCSFSPASLLAEMRLWMDKAEAKLASM
jgi:hypothetical protein